MSIKQKIKSAWNKMSSKFGKDSDKCDCGCGKDRCDCGRSDSELAAEEVIEEEVFPAPVKRKCGAKRTACKKPASKRTRPTNNNYQMIDPDNDTCDTGKS